MRERIVIVPPQPLVAPEPAIKPYENPPQVSR
jgi:hypothetical protein